MDRLELRVRETDLHEQWQFVLGVQELLEGTQRDRHVSRRRRHERRLGKRAPAWADPVLAAAQLAGRQA